MNRSKRLCILLGILAAVCIAAFAAAQMEERTEQIKSSGAVVLELPSESVQSLSWEYSGEMLSFHREETWLYDGDENFPVSAEKICDLLEQFQSFCAAFTIEDAEDLGQYGLDDPVCTIKLSTAEQTCEIKLGDYSKMDSQRYVSIGDGNVYLVRHDPLDEYDAVLSDMIEHDEIPSFNHVTQIQLAGAEAYSITYQEDCTDSYSSDDVYFTQRGGKNLPLDTSRVESYLRSITNLNPVDYVSYSVTDEELQTYGLDAPELTITVDYTTKDDNGEETRDTFALHISPDPEDVKAAEKAEEDDQEAEISAYIRVGESQIVYKIPSSSYRKLAAASYNDLRHPEVIWVDFSDVQQIDITLEGNSCALISQQDGDERIWRYQEEEFEITSFWSSLEALTAIEFTSEPPAKKEEIRLTIHLDSESSPQVQINLYRYDGSRCLAAVDGESVSLVERAAVVNLMEAVHAIVLK